MEGGREVESCSVLAQIPCMLSHTDVLTNYRRLLPLSLSLPASLSRMHALSLSLSLSRSIHQSVCLSPSRALSGCCAARQVRTRGATRPAAGLEHCRPTAHKCHCAGCRRARTHTRTRARAHTYTHTHTHTHTLTRTHAHAHERVHTRTRTHTCRSATRCPPQASCVCVCVCVCLHVGSPYICVHVCVARA
jgi:hypothetical protein